MLVGGKHLVLQLRTAPGVGCSTGAMQGCRAERTAHAGAIACRLERGGTTQRSGEGWAWRGRLVQRNGGSGGG